MSTTQAYLEHVAIYVGDIAPHIAFFDKVFGMTVTQVKGAADNPDQVWLLGGIQFIRKEGFAGPEGRFAHLGLVCADMEAAIEAALAHGAKATDQGHNWLLLPDNLYLELMPNKGESVQIARANDRRI
ncbi:hypothetical protein RYZ20_15045 [Thioclava sp. A2]|uniref:VOC family protein n=1 Tax=Thioclava sp. FCG-A2 TaxID=3080562 RepID=UPI0029552A61|nr:VOC family protein [Thioclava sp. A2]MDV7272209.1 hypothetical protein [Thioclava sp. A2]